MSQAFVIMQINHPQLDKLYSEAIVPAIKNCSLEPKRVDKHNEGRLLQSEIARFIERADIIVADLTNERPNCYLEVGYAMGLDKFRNLILTVRKDHFLDNKMHKPGGPKVHFDLSAYDILGWEEGNLDEFKNKLQSRIKQRLAAISRENPKESPLDSTWFQSHKELALKELSKYGKPTHMEISSALNNSKLNLHQGSLKEIAKKAAIHYFGWPIGVVLDGNEEARPVPEADGIVANIHSKSRPSYDHWAFGKDGKFYYLGMLNENVKKPGKINFNIRIIRIAESLLHAKNMYSLLDVPKTAPISLRIRHGGLRGQQISATGDRRITEDRYKTSESEVSTEIITSLEELESNLVPTVEKFSMPFFAVFNYFEVPRNVTEQIVNSYIHGIIT